MVKECILNFVFENENTLLTILIFSIIYTIVNVIISFNFQFVIDRAINYSSQANLRTLIFIFVFIYSLKIILDYSREKLINFINHKLNYTLIINSLNHILSLPHLYFKNRSTGEVLSRITDLDELKNTISDFVVTIFIDLLIVIASYSFHICLNNSYSK